MNKELMFSSESDEWETPNDLFQEMNRKYGPFDFDAAASFDNAKLDKWLGEKEAFGGCFIDGLRENWSFYGKKAWLNPPYSKPENKCKSNCNLKRCKERGWHRSEYKPGQIDFVKKAYEEIQNGVETCLLIPSRTDTEIFHKYIWNNEIMAVRPWVKFLEFLPYRVKFLKDGQEQDPAPFPSIIVVFGREHEED